jgi:hypothetical protein
MHHSLFATPASALSTLIVLPSGRLWLARSLRDLGARLASLGRRLAGAERSSAAARPPPAVSWSQVEFHAEAGAPEGAVFVDGEFIGHLPVSRL